jgi:hypothetical protein
VDCEPTSEPCDEVYCEKCVRQCDDYYIRITDPDSVAPGGDLVAPGKILTIGSNEPLAMTLQKILLYIRDKDCAEEDNSVNGHAPYYVYLTNITQTTIDINWTGWSSVTLAFEVLISTTDGYPEISFTIVGTPITPATPTHTVTIGAITPLIPDTEYVVKVRARGPVVNCDSVQIAVRTLL